MAKFLPRKPEDNRDLAARFYREIGPQLRIACRNASPSESFLAGLISVENSNLNTRQTRFEPAVFDALRKVRDGRRANYGSIVEVDLMNCSDQALINLASSWGLCQVMGYHSLNTLHCTIADLRDPDKHLGLAVQLLEIVAGKQHKPNLFELKKYDAIYRIWNTGIPTGKTFDPCYVQNALAVMEAYDEARASIR